MITKESEPGQSVTLIELEDGRFIEVRQEEDRLAIIIPPFTERWYWWPWIIIIYGIGVFRKTTLRFTNTYLHIERRFAFFRRRIPLHQVGEASCEEFDDLYINWPEDIVMIPLGKNDCFNIHHIKAFEDRKYLANVINLFLTRSLSNRVAGRRASEHEVSVSE